MDDTVKVGALLTYARMAALAISAAVFDFRTRRIPNPLVVTDVGLGMVLTLWQLGWAGVLGESARAGNRLGAVSARLPVKDDRWGRPLTDPSPRLCPAMGREKSGTDTYPPPPPMALSRNPSHPLILSQ